MQSKPIILHIKGCTVGRADLLKFGVSGSAVFLFNAILYTYNEIKHFFPKKTISPTGNGFKKF